MEITFDYKLDGYTYKVLIVKKNNKNTYIKIKDDLTIYVTTNYLTSKREIKIILDNEKEFLRKIFRSSMISDSTRKHVSHRCDV